MRSPLDPIQMSNITFRSERLNLRSHRSLLATLFLTLVLSICLAKVIEARAAKKYVQSQTLYQVVVENGIRSKMRDGVSLVADIYRPKAEGKFPVLLERTPYDRKDESSMAFELASHGYVVVLQDTRGRYESEGDFYPFRDESLDGFDTVEWAAKLDYADGKVGMFGSSYVGATQMLAAMARPPHLIAIFPYVTGSEYYDGWTYQNGVLMQLFTSSWTSILAVDTLRRRAEESRRPKDWVTTLPLENYPVISLPTAGSLSSYFRDWLEHERSDAYWRRWRISDHYGEMTVKGLHAAGWHDLFLKGSIKNYTGLHTKAGDPNVRGGQRLIIGPWAHAPISAEGRVGDVVFGRSAVLDMTGTALKWFDYSP